MLTQFHTRSSFFPLNEPKGFSSFLAENSDYVTEKIWGLVPTAKATYFMGKRDALIIFGCSPPEVGYFHMRTFMGVRFSPLHMPSATLGDTINNVNMNTSTGVGGFNSTYLWISTSDDATYDAIVNAFDSAFKDEGLPFTASKASNREVVPGGHWVNFLKDPNSKNVGEDTWKEDGSDSLFLLGRFSLFLLFLNH